MRFPFAIRNETIRAICFGGIIVIAALIAHGGCLRAIFYLDDWGHIVDSDFIETGKWWEAGTNALAYLTYWATWRIAGYSPQAFHAVNLLLHIALALCVYFFGHIFWPHPLQNGRALRYVMAVGALIFAVHPLTSEITNYARARDHELVGLFSFLAAVCAALWIRRGWKWFPALALCTLAAALSKGPGIWHAITNVVIALACLSTSADWRARFPTRWWIYGSIFAVEAVLAIFRDQVAGLVMLSLYQFSDWRFGWHLLTQSRVIWQYVWRMIVPVRLCSDHLIAWTRSVSDLSAWLGLVGLLLWIAVTIWLWWRQRRLEALLSAMILAPLLLRFGYVVSELMVEYRTYPAMPWVGLLFAQVLVGYQWRFPRAGKAMAFAIIVSFTALSNLRSRDWWSSEKLFGNILTRYPLQLRAYNGMSSEDLRDQRYQAVIDRSPEFFAKLEQLLAKNRTDRVRYYDNWPLCVVFEECNIAEAVLEVHGASAARDHLRRTAKRMRANRIENEDLWSHWHFTMGKVEYRAGDALAGERQFSLVDPAFISPRALAKEREKAGKNMQEKD